MLTPTKNEYFDLFGWGGDGPNLRHLLGRQATFWGGAPPAPVNFEPCKQNKYVHIPNLVSQELTMFIYNYLVIKACTNREFADSGDSSDENFIRQCYADLNIET